MAENLNNLLNQFLNLKEKTEGDILDGTFQFISFSERSEILKRLKEMKSRILFLVDKFKIGIAAGLLSLSLVAFSVNQLNAQTSPVKAASLVSSSLSDNTPNGTLNTSGVLLYEQWDNPSGNGAPVQNFESTFDIYDCEGAVDFVVPDGKAWTIDEIEIAFSYASLPLTNTNVTVRFYKDNGGIPGTLIQEFVDFDINTTNFVNNGTIPLPFPVTVSP